jgi:hypothetical protein
MWIGDYLEQGRDFMAGKYPILCGALLSIGTAHPDTPSFPCTTCEYVFKCSRVQRDPGRSATFVCKLVEEQVDSTKTISPIDPVR